MDVLALSRLLRSACISHIYLQTESEKFRFNYSLHLFETGNQQMVVFSDRFDAMDGVDYSCISLIANHLIVRAKELLNIDDALFVIHYPSCDGRNHFKLFELADFDSVSAKVLSFEQFICLVNGSKLWDLDLVQPPEKLKLFPFKSLKSFIPQKNILQTPSIEVGDIVRLKQPYKVDDFRYSDSFLAALNDGILPEFTNQKRDIYLRWQGFEYGIVNQIISYKQDGSPRNVSLFLYHAREDGTWLMYSYTKGIPSFVDFGVNELVLIHKSSAKDYSTGDLTHPKSRI